MTPTPEQAGWWLAGFIDGEGCVYFREGRQWRGKRVWSRLLTITNTNLALMDYCAQCFDVLGIHYVRGMRSRAAANPKHADAYFLNVRRGADLERVRLSVPIQCPEKVVRLNDALASYRHLRCVQCGVLHDEQTPGCYDCRKRHQLRQRTIKARAARALAAEQRRPPPSLQEPQS